MIDDLNVCHYSWPPDIKWTLKSSTLILVLGLPFITSKTVHIKAPGRSVSIQNHLTVDIWLSHKPFTDAYERPFWCKGPTPSSFEQSTFITIVRPFGYRHVGDQSMLVTLCWWQFLDVGDEKSMLVTFFEMLVTIKSVTNITRRENTMLVTDFECWWH